MSSITKSYEEIRKRAFYEGGYGMVTKKTEYVDSDGEKIPIVDYAVINNLGEVWSREHTNDYDAPYVLLEDKHPKDICKEKVVSKPANTEPKWHVYYKAINVSKMHLNRMIRLLRYDIKDVDQIKAVKNKNGYYTMMFTNTRGD